MADVSRTSTFPPILRSYHSGIFTSSEPFSALHAVHTKPEAHADGPKRRAPSFSGKQNEAGTNQQRGSSSGLLSTDKIKKEQELEQRRKRNQRAEATLMCWEALQEEHRLQKYQTLQRRVGIQRDLITKNDQLLSELRKRDEEVRLEKIQSRKTAQKKLTKSLRTHIQRIEEHKKKIAEKFDMLKAEEELEDDDTEEQIESSPVHQSGLIHNETTQEEGEHNEKPIRAQNEVSSAVNQMLGDNSKPDTRAMLESLWGGKKSATNRRLRPIIQYSDQLKQEASPSVKQCLEVYEHPTAHDRFTGKPIPLGDILNNIINKAEMSTNHSNWNRAIELMSKHLQKRAQTLLSRKDPYNSLDHTLSSNEGWFTELCGEIEDRTRAKTAFASAGSNRRRKDKAILLQRRRANSSGTAVELKKRLPTFLTPDGDLLTGSLEEFGSQIYCSPSRLGGVPSVKANGQQQHSTGSSVFLTDFQDESLDSGTLEPKLTKNRTAREESTKQPVTAVRWQPLSLGALTEHSSVTEIPVKGLGNLAHGKYSMWKQDQSFSVKATD